MVAKKNEAKVKVCAKRKVELGDGLALKKGGDAEVDCGTLHRPEFLVAFRAGDVTIEDHPVDGEEAKAKVRAAVLGLAETLGTEIRTEWSRMEAGLRGLEKMREDYNRAHGSLQATIERGRALDAAAQNLMTAVGRVEVPPKEKGEVEALEKALAELTSDVAKALSVSGGSEGDGVAAARKAVDEYYAKRAKLEADLEAARRAYRRAVADARGLLGPVLEVLGDPPAAVKDLKVETIGAPIADFG